MIRIASANFSVLCIAYLSEHKPAEIVAVTRRSIKAVTDSEKGSWGGSTWLIKAANHNPSVYMPPYEDFFETTSR